jgi:hypothetical protein
MAQHEYQTLRAISNYFFEVSGLYERLCKYFATLYRYDWYITPYIIDEKVKDEKVLTDFAQALDYMDESYIKKLCGEIALKVIVNGCYYGYIVDTKKGFTF